MTKIQLNTEQGESGWWFVTSPEPKGLLMTAPTLAEALALVPKALADLDAANA